MNLDSTLLSPPSPPAPGRPDAVEIELELDPLGCCARVTLGSWIRDSLE